MTLSTDERRALALIAGLLVLAGGARWLDRPRPVLDGVDPIDVGRLEEESRARKLPAGPDPKGPARPAGKVDPNTASAAELTRLPGVGPSLAARIVEERGRRPFDSLEDLIRVRGIGPALATGWADLVSLPRASPRAAALAKTALTPEETDPSRAPQRVPAGSLDLNEISSADLQRVPGIGPVLAARLLARRDSLGRFARWEQVDSVAGVGPALLSRLRERLVIAR